jgi:hypothetical protein
LGWVKQNALPDDQLILDPSIWTDLQAPPLRGTGYRNAHPYWRLERDPELRTRALQNDWRNVNYLIVTPQMLQDAQNADLRLVIEAYQHSRSVGNFDTGGWPIDIRKVDALSR